MIQFLIKIFIVIIAGGASLILIAYLVQDRMIFFPSKGLFPGSENFVDYEITLKCGEVKLHGWRVPDSRRQTNSPLIIYFGGNAEEVSGNLAEFRTRGITNFLMVNYRGYGNSTGKPTEAALFQDALFIFDYFTGKGQASDTPVILMGRSLGTAVAVHVASRRKVAGVVLVTPFDSLVNVAKVHYPFLPVKWLVRHPFNSVQQAPHLKTSLLTLIAGRDEIIPNENSYKLVAQWAGPTRTVLIPDAGHNDIHLYPEYWAALHDFIKQP